MSPVRQPCKNKKKKKFTNWRIISLLSPIGGIKTKSARDKLLFIIFFLFKKEEEGESK
jgi:hypothetical protein